MNEDRRVEERRQDIEFQSRAVHLGMSYKGVLAVSSIISLFITGITQSYDSTTKSKLESRIKYLERLCIEGTQKDSEKPSDNQKLCIIRR